MPPGTDPFAPRVNQRDRLATQQITFPAFNKVQADVFRDWYEVTLVDGGAWFSATWSLPEGIVAATRRFIGTPRWQYLSSGYWRVTAVCEVRGRAELPLGYASPLWHWRFENSGNAGSIGFTPDTVVSDGGPNSFRYTPTESPALVPALFGTYSGYFNGTNNHLTSSYIPPEWRQFGEMDFTLEGFDTGEGDIICTGSYGTYGNEIGPDPTSGQIRIGFIDGNWQVEYSTALGSDDLVLVNPGIPGGDPRHWALVSDATSLRFYVQGVKHMETMGVRPFVAPYITGQMFIVGALYTGGGASLPVFLGHRYSGLMDEMRMCAAALYTGATFTPPAGPLPDRY